MQMCLTPLTCLRHFARAASTVWISSAEEAKSPSFAPRGKLHLPAAISCMHKFVSGVVSHETICRSRGDLHRKATSDTLSTTSGTPNTKRHLIKL